MYRPVTPAQAVEVERDGRWHAGELQAWRKDDDGSWVAFVLYGVVPGMRYLDWVPADSATSHRLNARLVLARAHDRGCDRRLVSPLCSAYVADQWETTGYVQ